MTSYTSYQVEYLKKTKNKQKKRFFFSRERNCRFVFEHNICCCDTHFHSIKQINNNNSKNQTKQNKKKTNESHTIYDVLSFTPINMQISGKIFARINLRNKRLTNILHDVH